MTTIRNTAIAAIAAITIAASMASPANALSNKAKWGIAFGVGSALAIGAAHAHSHGYYGHGYYDGYYGGGYYKRIARKCAYRHGWHTLRFEKCMDRHGL